jgi:hypothetical protein
MRPRLQKPHSEESLCYSEISSEATETRI